MSRSPRPRTAMHLGRFMLVTALSLALGGCVGFTGSHETGAEVNAVPAVSRPAIPDPPVAPAELTKINAIGAEAFIEYWWQLHNYSYASMDTRLLQQFSWGGICVQCSAVVSDITAKSNRGQFVIGGDVELTGLESLNAEHFGDGAQNAYTYVITVSQQDLIAYDEAGLERSSVPGFTDMTADMTVTYEDGQWLTQALSTPSLTATSVPSSAEADDGQASTDADN